jgi:hypothetical protein
LPELSEKESFNFVLLLMFGSAKPKSSLFLARGVHHAPVSRALVTAAGVRFNFDVDSIPIAGFRSLQNTC